MDRTMKVIDLEHMNSEITRLYNEIAQKSKKEYTELIDSLTRKYGEDEFWWCTPLASRNVFVDRTFKSFCMLKLCLELIADSSEKIKRIIVPYRDLSVCLQRLDIVRSQKIEIVSHEGKGEKKRKIIIRILNCIKRELSTIHGVKKYYTPRTDFSHSFTLIACSLLYNSFLSGEYVDRDFCGILDLVPEKRIIFLPTLIKNSEVSWKDFLDRVNNAGEYKFLCYESFLKYSDIKKYLCYVMYCKKLMKESFFWNDFDITEIVAFSLASGIYNTTSVNAVLSMCYIPRMKRAGLLIDNLIFWHEARPSDVMLAYSFRQCFPESRCIGYIGFPPSEYNIGVYPSKEQLRFGTVPTRLAIPGKAYIDISQQFSKNDIILVPSLRNNFLSRITQKCQYEKKNILIILPYCIEIAKSLLESFNECVKTFDENIVIRIKNHPANEGFCFGDYTNYFCNFEYEIVHGTLDEWVDKSDIVIYSSSSSALKIISKGTFCIAYTPLGELDCTCIPDDFPKDFYSKVYNSEELYDAIKKGIAFLAKRSFDINMKDYVEPTEREGILRFWTDYL